MINLANKKIIITGANGGLGSLVAKLLARESANLILISFDEEALQKQCEEIQNEGGKADYITADFSTIDGIKDIAAIIAEIDNIYMIIHLAGIMHFGSLGQASTELIEKLYNINLLTPILLTKAVLPEMIKNKSGHIVNIGSMVGSIAFPYFTTYSSSKAGLRGFSEALDRELIDTGVRSSYLSPRATKTALNAGKIPEFHKLTKTNLDAPEIVAEQIITAIKKQVHSAYFGFPESLYAKLNYLFPNLITKAIKGQIDIARKLLMNDEK